MAKASINQKQQNNRSSNRNSGCVPAYRQKNNREMKKKSMANARHEKSISWHQIVA